MCGNSVGRYKTFLRVQPGYPQLFRSKNSTLVLPPRAGSPSFAPIPSAVLIRFVSRAAFPSKSATPSTVQRSTDQPAGMLSVLWPAVPVPQSLSPRDQQQATYRRPSRRLDSRLQRRPNGPGLGSRLECAAPVSYLPAASSSVPIRRERAVDLAPYICFREHQAVRLSSPSSAG